MKFLKINTLILIWAIIFGFQINVKSQTTQNFTTVGTSSFTVPCGVTSITVQVWGGGGAGGGGSVTSANGGSGGGGGGYCTQVISVTPGSTISYTVGAGGVGGTGNGGNGGSSSFGSVSATGGTGGAENGGAAGIGGTGCTSNGSNGVISTSSTGGVGGGGANGGAGGAGGTLGNDGTSGSVIGGGGGGGGTRSGGSESGGNGARGQVTITYNVDSFNQYGGTSCTGAGSMTSGGSYGGDFCEADGTGSYTSANECGVVAQDEIWYSITLPAGCSTLDVEITNNTTGGNLSVEILTSTTNSCNPTIIEGAGCGTAPIAIGNFPPTTAAGKMVWIRVTGDAINEPNGTFTITPTLSSGLPAPTEDACNSPEVISPGSFSGDNFCATASTTVDPTPSLLCAVSIENTVWYQYCPTSSGTFTVSFSNISCAGGGAGIQAGVFTNAGGSSPICTAGSWTQVLETDGTPGCGSTSTSSLTIGPMNMTAGTCYYVGVDGNAGAFCSYDINLSAVLPIKIVKINAIANQNSNIISWITASEINNQWQIVEKSADGISNWTEVDRVSGSMSSDGNRSYEVIDNKPFGLTYYRIHSIDYDGFEEFSDIVYARSNNFAIDNNVQIVPNPTSGHINVLYYSSTDTELAVTITDASGRKFYTEKNQILKGENAKGIDVSNLTSGLYFLQTELDGKVSNKRFVKY